MLFNPQYMLICLKIHKTSNNVAKLLLDSLLARLETNNLKIFVRALENWYHMFEMLLPF